MDSSSWLAEFRSVVGKSLALAIGVGSLLALITLLHSVIDNNFASKLLLAISVYLVGWAGVHITKLVHRADPGQWRGYILRVIVATACTLVIGIWANLCYWMLSLLRKMLIGDPQLSPVAEYFVNVTPLVGLVLPTILALIISVSLGRKTIREMA